MSSLFTNFTKEVFDELMANAGQQIIVRAYEEVNEHFPERRTKFAAFTTIGHELVVCVHNEFRGLYMPLVNVWDDSMSSHMRGQVELIYSADFVDTGFLGHGVDVATNWSLEQWHSKEPVLYAKGVPFRYVHQPPTSHPEATVWELLEPSTVPVFLQDIARMEALLRVVNPKDVGGDAKNIDPEQIKDYLKAMRNRMTRLLDNLNGDQKSSLLQPVKI